MKKMKGNFLCYCQSANKKNRLWKTFKRYLIKMFNSLHPLRISYPKNNIIVFIPKNQ